MHHHHETRDDQSPESSSTTWVWSKIYISLKQTWLDTQKGQSFTSMGILCLSHTHTVVISNFTSHVH